MSEGGTGPDTTPGGDAGGRKKQRRTEGRDLATPRTRVSPQSRTARLLLGLVGLLLLVGWLVWYAMTPEKLPTTDKTITASGVVDTPLYVGMFAASDTFGRTLRISGVKVHATTSVDLSVTPLLCRRGTVGVTTAPEQFCADLVDPEGERLVGGDSIVLKIESAEAAVAVIDQIQIAYREDIRWDTQPAGADKAIITIAGRPETQPEDDSTDAPTTSPSAAPSSTSSGAATPSGGASGSPSSPPSGTPTGIVPRTTGATPSSNATP